MSFIQFELLKTLKVNIIRSSAIQRAFSDSTHRLWSLETADQQSLFLKVVEKVDTPFWQVMQALFSVDLRTQLGEYIRVYQTVSALTPMLIPDLIDCASQTSTSPAYLLTSKMIGCIAQADQVSDDIVVDLASHLAGLHKAKQSTWGSVLDSGCAAADWSVSLRQTLLDYFPNDELINGFSHQPSCFVPMMPDLRWDQFLMVDGRLSALVDLDAFVLAPIELDFVLLEYLLSPEQLALWSHAYQNAGGAIPSIAYVRDVYRKLLFAMQVLGEDDLTCWLSRPSYFA